MFGKVTKEERSWILYDVGNSAFVLIIVTTVMPIFFKEYAALDMSQALSTARWGYANSAASLALAILAPVLGTFADYQDKKKKFFMFFVFLGFVMTLALSTIQHGGWLLALIFFVLARIGWAGANIFYDAFIVDVTEYGRMDKISSLGYAWGYIGSVVPFLVVMAVLFTGMVDGGPAIPPVQAKIGFVIVAFWWLLFSLPMFKQVKQLHFIPTVKNPVSTSFKRLGETLKSIKKHKQVMMFLIAYFFYIDGVDTIISMSAAYGIEIGLSSVTLILAILMIQVVAFPFALLYGRLAEKYGAKKMLFAGIMIYVVITLLAFVMPSLGSDRLKTYLFWILAFLVATSMGGIQALSRSWFGKLIPAEKSAEYFGFYNIFGKFAAITGPFLMGLTGTLSGHSKYGVLSILLLFLVGGIMLAKVKETPASS